MNTQIEIMSSKFTGKTLSWSSRLHWLYRWPEIFQTSELFHTSMIPRSWFLLFETNDSSVYIYTICMYVYIYKQEKPTTELIILSCEKLLMFVCISDNCHNSMICAICYVSWMKRYLKYYINIKISPPKFFQFQSKGACYACLNSPIQKYT